MVASVLPTKRPRDALGRRVISGFEHLEAFYTHYTTKSTRHSLPVFSQGTALLSHPAIYP